MEGQPIRVVVADDQPLFRRGAAEALQGHPELEVVTQTANGEPALRAIIDLEPDAAVLGGALPPHEWTHLLREVSRWGPKTRILALIPSRDAEAIRSAVASGVGGYLTRNADETELCGTLTIVARGGTVIAEEVKASLTEAIAWTTDGDRNPLSEREQCVLERIAGGYAARRIADELYLSEATIKSYLRRIYAKLGVATQAAAVAEAMQRDLIAYGPARSLANTRISEPRPPAASGGR